MTYGLFSRNAYHSDVLASTDYVVETRFAEALVLAVTFLLGTLFSFFLGFWPLARTTDGCQHGPFRSCATSLLSADHDESAAATSACQGSAAAGDGWHVEEGDFANVRLSSTPWQCGQRIGCWPVHSRMRSIQLLDEGGVDLASSPRSRRQRGNLVATLVLASRP